MGGHLPSKDMLIGLHRLKEKTQSVDLMNGKKILNTSAMYFKELIIKTVKIFIAR